MGGGTGGVGTNPCSADDLVRYGKMALDHPASCAFINRRYDEDTWKRADIRDVWQGLVEMAKKRGGRADQGAPLAVTP